MFALRKWKSRNHLPGKIIMLVWFVSLGVDSHLGGLECEPMEWFISFHCFTASQNILLNYLWSWERVSWLSRGWRWPGSIYSRSEKFLCSVTLTLKKVVHFPFHPHMCCNSNNHLTSLWRYKVEDTLPRWHLGNWTFCNSSCHSLSN